MAERISGRSLGAVLKERARRSGESMALCLPEGSVTWRELDARADQVADGLLALGVQPGDRVGILMHNSARYAAVFFGAARVGAISVLINARFRSRDLAQVVEHAGVRVIFTVSRQGGHPDYLERLHAAIPELGTAVDRMRLHPSSAPALQSVVTVDDRTDGSAITWPGFVQAGDEAKPGAPECGRPSADDCALLLYTSGTTAAPKGCMITHRALLENWAAWAAELGLSTSDRVWAPGPYFHISGIGPLIGSLVTGAATLTAGHFEPDEAASLALRHRAAHWFPGFPALSLGILGSRHYDERVFGFLRTVHNVAPPEVQEQIQRLLPAGAVVTSNFGMTEGAGCISFTPLADPAEVRLTSTGPASPGFEIRVADPAYDAAAPAGELGEIQFRSPHAFSGYWQDEKATAETILPGGWIKSGDLGLLDEHGRLYYRGRLKDMLKVGGENVVPLEVESLLAHHTAVRLAQVVGRPDPRLGEVPVAFVELNAGSSASAEELIGLVAGQIASFKVPRAVIFVEEWPMNATKVRKDVLRQWAAGETN